jgi:FixJ family two-component response regulator
MTAVAQDTRNHLSHEGEEEPTVFIVDDDRALCEALTFLLESVNLPCRTFRTAQEFLDGYDPDRPGCLVLDVRMPGMSGLDFQGELAVRNYQIPVIMITGYADVSMAVRAIKAGAVEFLEKPFGDQVILECIQQAIERDRKSRKMRAERAEFEERLSRLTPREREVMDLLMEGLANKAIAAKLSLARKTIETHRANLMAKMKAASLADLIRRMLIYRDPARG